MTDAPKTKKTNQWEWGYALIILSIIPITMHWLDGGPWADALRYCAYATQPRPWNDTTWLTRTSFGSTSPGWDTILHILHIIGLKKAGLLDFSVFGLCGLVFGTALKANKNVIATITGIGIVALTNPGIYYHWTCGRPFLITAAAWVILTKIWDARNEVRKETKIATTMLAIASTWIHGCWYLLPTIALPIALNSDWKRALDYIKWTMLGVALGAGLTGHPWHYLNFQLRWGLMATLSIPSSEMVGELKPANVTVINGIGILILLAWDQLAKPQRQHRIGLNDWSVLVCWAAGAWIGRFWWDFGTLGLIIWVARKTSETLAWVPKTKWVAASLGGTTLATALALSQTIAPVGKPWFQQNESQWEPAHGGTLFNSNMGAYYQNYYRSPNMEWKTAVGYESTAAPINMELGYIAVRKAPENPASYENWLRLMKKTDRLSLLSAKPPPQITGITWHKCNQNWWVGKPNKNWKNQHRTTTEQQ